MAGLTLFPRSTSSTMFIQSSGLLTQRNYVINSLCIFIKRNKTNISNSKGIRTRDFIFLNQTPKITSHSYDLRFQFTSGPNLTYTKKRYHSICSTFLLTGRTNYRSIVKTASYHAHHDGPDMNIHPNTFNSEEQTKKFVKRLRRKQRILLLNELQTLYQEQNKDVTNDDQGVLSPPTRHQLNLVILNNTVPFIGFGFLDNAIMIIAGDYIDWKIGAALGISTLAAAGLGNLISDIAGVALAGYVEAFAAKLGIPTPKLSLEQYDMRSSQIAAALGRCLGIAVGCLLGMFPLLFLQNDPREDSTSKDEN